MPLSGGAILNDYLRMHLYNRNRTRFHENLPAIARRRAHL